MVLAELKTGEEAVIVKVKGYGAFRKRLNEMGFIRGKVVKAVKNAPLNDPIEYSIMGYEVSLRRRESAFVEIVSLQEASDIVGVSGELQEVVEVFAEHWKERDKNINVVFVGNPNAGKTTLFNYVSGSSERVGNYGGVTVDAKEARFRFGGYRFNVVDLPGTYSLTAYSSEERFVREYIMNNAPDVIINVVDASNLERNLYLTTQLIDMDVKGVIALNMYDELERSGAVFDYQGLGKLIGMPIIPTVAAKGKGVKELLQEVIEVYEGRSEYVRHVHIHYGNEVEEGIVAIRAELDKEKDLVAEISPRLLALKLLEKDSEALRFINRGARDERLNEICREQTARIESLYGEPVEAVVTDAKYGFISGALKETYRETRVDKHRRTTYIDSVLTHKILGIPLFLFFLFVTFFVTFALGNYPKEWIEQGVVALNRLVKNGMGEGMLRDMLIDGIINGVGGVIVFLPHILILFFFISFMEDTGYMARAAFIMDKLMHKIGLHGKSFIPLIMGFGCNVPAIMATRMLENRNDRLLTILINPFMSCSARLPVYLLFVGAFFESYSAITLFGIYLFGILMAVVMGKLFKKTLFNKEEAPFVMELPPYRMPTLRTTLRHMWNKGKQYLKKMGGIIMIASILIWALGYFPLNKEMEARYEQQREEVSLSDSHRAEMWEALLQQEVIERQSTSLMNRVKKEKELIWGVLGYFPVSKALKELREQQLQEFSRHDQMLKELRQQEVIERQATSYIGRIGRGMEPIWEPLGFDWRAGVSLLTGMAAKEIVISTMSILYLGDDSGNEDEDSDLLKERLSAYYSPALAFIFMIFILLYTPCFAAVIAISKEAGWKWGFFVMGYTTALAWGTCYVLKLLLGWIL
ncbi:MAG: ferrous iron transport protein B [Odoribacteraceae bacterium]|jgi:ferrous iron transport protein B|nr:ferrous iron transport protein B [Odoribacteraceae bacterium]